MQYRKIEQFLAFAIPNINLKLHRTTDDLKKDILYTMRKNTKIRLSQRYSWVEKKCNYCLLFPIFYLIEDRSPSRERYILKHTSAKTIYSNGISAEIRILIFILYKYSSNPTNYNTLIVQLTQKLQLFPATKPSIL